MADSPNRLEDFEQYLLEHEKNATTPPPTLENFGSAAVAGNFGFGCADSFNSVNSSVNLSEIVDLQSTLVPFTISQSMWQDDSDAACSPPILQNAVENSVPENVHTDDSSSFSALGARILSHDLQTGSFLSFSHHPVPFNSQKQHQQNLPKNMTYFSSAMIQPASFSHRPPANGNYPAEFDVGPMPSKLQTQHVPSYSPPAPRYQHLSPNFNINSNVQSVPPKQFYPQTQNWSVSSTRSAATFLDHQNFNQYNFPTFFNNYYQQDPFTPWISQQPVPFVPPPADFSVPPPQISAVRPPHPAYFSITGANSGWNSSASDFPPEVEKAIKFASAAATNFVKREQGSSNKYGSNDFNENLRKCDNSSIKLLAEACLKSHHRDEKRSDVFNRSCYFKPNDFMLKPIEVDRYFSSNVNLQRCESFSKNNSVTNSNVNLQYKSSQLSGVKTGFIKSEPVFTDTIDTRSISGSGSSLSIEEDRERREAEILAYYDDCCVNNLVLIDPKEEYKKKEPFAIDMSLKTDRIRQPVMKIGDCNPKMIRRRLRMSRYIKNTLKRFSERREKYRVISVDLRAPIRKKKPDGKPKLAPPDLDLMESNLFDRLDKLRSASKSEALSPNQVDPCCSFDLPPPAQTPASHEFTYKICVQKPDAFNWLKNTPDYFNDLSYMNYLSSNDASAKRRYDLLTEYFRKVIGTKPKRMLDDPTNSVSLVDPKDNEFEYVCRGKTQTHGCYQLPDVSRCVECADVHHSASDYCRFMDFRRFHKNPETGKLEVTGFATYNGNSALSRDRKLHDEFLPPKLDQTGTGSGVGSVPEKHNIPLHTALYVLSSLASQFKSLLEREEIFLVDCLRWNHINSDTDALLWRDSFNVRELCDVCTTTIFNLHLLCKFCGFVACIDCVYARIRCEMRLEEPSKNQDDYGWNFCTIEFQRVHKPSDLNLAQLIPDCRQRILSTLRSVNLSLNQQLNRFSIDIQDNDASSKFMVQNFTPKKPVFTYSTSPDHFQYYYMFERAILVLENPKLETNLQLFQKHWRKAKPVLVHRVTQELDHFMWRPSVFEEKCRGQRMDGTIVDCRTGAVIDDFDVKDFWAGFSDCHQRVNGLDDRKLYLKLKDWPPGEKFSSILKDQFRSLCKALPIPEYSHPEKGIYNLVTNLPSFCVRPDLGPKMYIAYEMIFEPSRGTTNLHLDISDAVNILVNVTTPVNINQNYLYASILNHLESQGLDPSDLERARKNPDKVGALWTIYKPEDSDTIRIFLAEMAEEISQTDFDDPIHDQLCYLHADLRKRLVDERGVSGYTFLQMLGDAVFIPAGAAHQVQNLLCCVKVAEDFVSPEGVSRCAAVAGEFRNLTKDHSNHEDKLQLPNIVLHSIREAVGTLQAVT